MVLFFFLFLLSMAAPDGTHQRASLSNPSSTVAGVASTIESTKNAAAILL